MDLGTQEIIIAAAVIGAGILLFNAGSAIDEMPPTDPETGAPPMDTTEDKIKTGLGLSLEPVFYLGDAVKGITWASDNPGTFKENLGIAYPSVFGSYEYQANPTYTGSFTPETPADTGQISSAMTSFINYANQIAGSSTVNLNSSTPLAGNQYDGFGCQDTAYLPAMPATYTGSSSPVMVPKVCNDPSGCYKEASYTNGNLSAYGKMLQSGAADCGVAMDSGGVTFLDWAGVVATKDTIDPSDIPVPYANNYISNTDLFSFLNPSKTPATVSNIVGGGMMTSALPPSGSTIPSVAVLPPVVSSQAMFAPPPKPTNAEQAAYTQQLAAWAASFSH